MPLWIPFIFALFVLVWFAHALTRVFQREVEPTRRRDLTLANAERLGELHIRISRVPEQIVRGAIALLVLGLCVEIWSSGMSITVHLMLTCFSMGLATISLVTSIPICRGVIAYLATRACIANQQLHENATLAGVVAPLVLLSQFCALATLSQYWFARSTVLGHEFLAWFFLVGIVIPLFSGLFLMYTSLAFPKFAIRQFLKAYPYSE